jgi:hypothetical protein
MPPLNVRAALAYAVASAAESVMMPDGVHSQVEIRNDEVKGRYCRSCAFGSCPAPLKVWAFDIGMRCKNADRVPWRPGSKKLRRRCGLQLHQPQQHRHKQHLQTVSSAVPPKNTRVGLMVSSILQIAPRFITCSCGFYLACQCCCGGAEAVGLHSGELTRRLCDKARTSAKGHGQQNARRCVHVFSEVVTTQQRASASK